MRRIDTIIIGGGQAGLAMSRCLRARSIDHVVLERGRVAERWRSERWDSLRLLTPSWQSRLPGWRYPGPDPDGYMSVRELVGHLETYAAESAAPVLTGTEVLALEARAGGYRVTTSDGAWQTRNVVIATGHCDVPRIPRVAARLSPRVHQLTPSRYKNPDQLPPGGVLVVGASATGVQLADEIQRSGRPVTLAVGRHIRLPRRYRGRDILWWLEATGILDETIDQVPNLEAARRQPSLQLVGRPDRSDLDLAVLQAQGVELVGRVVDAHGHRIVLAADLDLHVAASELKLRRTLARIERFVATFRPPIELAPPEPITGMSPIEPRTAIDLASSGIATVIWATGFTRRYDWLRIPVTSSSGEISHRGGITPAPGLYVLGLFFMRRRMSSFLDGVGLDARELTAHVAQRLGERPRAAA